MGRAEQAARIAGWLWKLFGLQRGALLRVADDLQGRRHKWNRRGIEAKLLELLQDNRGTPSMIDRIQFLVGRTLQDARPTHRAMLMCLRDVRALVMAPPTAEQSQYEQAICAQGEFDHQQE